MVACPSTSLACGQASFWGYPQILTCPRLTCLSLRGVAPDGRLDWAPSHCGRPCWPASSSTLPTVSPVPSSFAAWTIGWASNPLEALQSVAPYLCRQAHAGQCYCRGVLCEGLVGRGKVRLLLGCVLHPSLRRPVRGCHHAADDATRCDSPAGSTFLRRRL